MFNKAINVHLYSFTDIFLEQQFDRKAFRWLRQFWPSSLQVDTVFVIHVLCCSSPFQFLKINIQNWINLFKLTYSGAHCNWPSPFHLENGHRCQSANCESSERFDEWIGQTSVNFSTHHIFRGRLTHFYVFSFIKKI